MTDYLDDLRNIMMEDEDLLDKILLTAKEEVDYWSLKYINKIGLEQFICPICQMVLVDPYSTKCGHTFCRKCILDAYSSSMESYRSESNSVNGSGNSRPPLFRCPVDRHPLPNPKDIQPAPFLISSLVNDLVVACPFADKGCIWEDKRWLLEKHVGQDCQFVNVQCGGVKRDGINCEDLAMRGDVLREIKRARENGGSVRVNDSGVLDTVSKGSTSSRSNSSDDSSDRTSSQSEGHPTSKHNVKSSRQKTGKDYTSRVMYKCVHEQTEENQLEQDYSECQCGESIDGNDIERHISEDCMAVTAICEDCQETIEKPLLEFHHREHCPEGLLYCPAQVYGCDWSGKRCDEKARGCHQLECTFIKLMPILSQQSSRLDSLERENQALRMCMERLTSITNDSLNSHVDAGSSTSDTPSINSFTDSDLLHMFMECERLRRDVDQLNSTSNDMYLKQGMMMMRENLRLSEEMNVLRSGFNSLRHQLHFLLTERRSWASHYYHGSTDTQNPTGADRATQRSLGDLLRDVKL